MADGRGKNGPEEANAGPPRGEDSDKIKLFISYSHDSETHQEWVRELAERLQRDGIDVVFDQQNLRPGMPAALFMEDSLRDCDRVLVVITESYVTKAQNLTGGVAYERMIITDAITKDLRTTRFIPVLRSGGQSPEFLQGRTWVDATDETAWEKNYQKLLAELTRPMEPVASGSSTREAGKVVELKPAERRNENLTKSRSHKNCHWSHEVHFHVGNKLYLIFVKFRSTGVKFTRSIAKSIADARVSNFETYELYASYDLLIRAWVDQASYYALQESISNNVHVENTEWMEARAIHHFPDRSLNATEHELRQAIEEIDGDLLDNIQNGTAGEGVVNELIRKGLRIPTNVRFDNEKIQFYIIVSALKHDERPITKFRENMARFSSIHNKTIYRTVGNASEAVIKGQVARDRYYDINEFVNAVTDDLDDGNIRTETALVAQRGPRGDDRIDTRAAERHLIEKKYRNLIGVGARLDPEEDLTLLVHFIKAAPAMAEDRVGILRQMIKLRSEGCTDEFGHLRSFFSEFETLLRNNVTSVMARLFGSRFDEEKKRLFKLEGISDSSPRGLVLGDLTKVYRRLVAENGIITLDPLTETEFTRLMAEAVQIRNTLSHGVPDATFWDNTFQFFNSFVRIESRLRRYLESNG